jgi:acetoin utilization protein AcuB
MTKNPTFLDPEARIETAWKLMHDQRVRHVPICKGKKIVGLITQKDLLVNAQNSALLSLPVAEVMVFDVKTVSPDATTAEVAKIMLNDRISCLPVVDNDELVGIITESDFLGLLIELVD